MTDRAEQIAERFARIAAPYIDDAEEQIGSLTTDLLDAGLRDLVEGCELGAGKRFGPLFEVCHDALAKASGEGET